MNRLCAKYQAWKQCRDGATAIEYSMIVGAVALAISAIIFFMGDSIAELLADINDTQGGAGAQ